MTWDAWSALLGQQPLLLCFLILATGMAFGAVRLAGLSLGASGVLFTALLFGHFGRASDWDLPNGMGTFGLVLFVYAVGLGAGQTFFRAFRNQGKQLAILSVVTVTVAAVAAFVLGKLFDIPAEMSVGIFAGAMTSTPGLASAVGSVDPAEASAVSIGYGLAYPLGVMFTVLYVQLLPRVLGVSLEDLGKQLSSKNESKHGIQRYLIEITNPTVFGKQLRELDALSRTSTQVTRVLQGERLIPIPSDHVLEKGQVLLMVAKESEADLVTMALGTRTDVATVIDSDHDRAEIVVTHPAFLNKSLRNLHLRGRYGITVSRIERYGVSFVPSGNTTLTRADRLVVVGPQEKIKKFEADAGHQPRRLLETDLMSLGIGLSVGIVLGSLAIPLGTIGKVSLGLAGGPLIAGLLFAHFGRFLGVVGYMPRAARMFVQEFGLALFLAEAGFHAGGSLMSMMGEFGAKPVVMSGLIAVVAIATAHFVARSLLKMNLLETLGGACGAMTSTAGVGAITSKTESDIPVISYAAGYPVALILMTIVVRVLVACSLAASQFELPWSW